MKNDDIQDLTTVAKDKAHSDADFMAEIDEQMNEIKSSPRKKGTQGAQGGKEQGTGNKPARPLAGNKEQGTEEQNTVYGIPNTENTRKDEENHAEETKDKEELPNKDAGEIIQVKKIPKPIVIAR